MEKFNAITEASKLAELSNTKQSISVSDYYLSNIVAKSDMPMMSYGLQLDRLADAPPSNLVDTESMLKNQFDLIGKSGHVYKPVTYPQSNAQEQPSSTSTSSSVKPSHKEFFVPISGRDFHSFSKKSCNSLSIWRDDINHSSAPIQGRFEYVDTRALTKDNIHN